MRVLCLDVDIDDERATVASFSSAVSVFEYDVVVWDPVNTLDSYVRAGYTYGKETYKGLPYVDLDTSSRYESDVKRRRAEFEEFIALGRVLVVFAAPPQMLMVDTGQTETSGTGRNQIVTNLVDGRDLHAALPYEFKATSAEGAAITAEDAELARLLREYQKWWYYRAILEDYPGASLALVTGTKKTVASLFRSEANGIVVQLPDIHPVLEERVPVDESSTSRAKTKLLRPRTPPELYSELLNWVSSLKGADDDLPAWLGTLQFVDAQPRVERLKELETSIARLTEEVSSLNLEQAADRRWLTLVTGTGVALEARATEAFELLGFGASAPVPGRRDIRIEADGRAAVVEVKGVGKSSAESHVMQLEKWVAEAYLESERSHKGVLLVNGWRDLPLIERADPVFTAQMLPTAVAREHCLLTGLQLLSMVRAVLAGRVEKAEVRTVILDTIGIVPGWVDTAQIFVASSESRIEAQASKPARPRRERSGKAGSGPAAREARP